MEISSYKLKKTWTLLQKRNLKIEIGYLLIAAQNNAIRTISSSSSYRAGSTDIPDPLSPLLPIVHRPR